LLRFFSEENPNQIWFLNPEQANISKIDTFVVISQVIRGQQEYVIRPFYIPNTDFNGKKNKKA
jgi:hypothetical protein